MVARIDSSNSGAKLLDYNEKKVQLGKAVLILAENFLADLKDLTRREKNQRFQRMNELNPGSEINMLHIKIGFHPSEKLTDQKMAAIAKRYMEGIGLQDQPYLVFRHKDTGNPHMHVLSNLIKADGRRTNTQNMGKKGSEKVRNEIEKEFNLVRAKGRKPARMPAQDPRNVPKIAYGESTIKESMGRVLQMAIKEYKFTSLEEMNAVLRPYNMRADRGSPSSATYKKEGLIYLAMNDQGKSVGAPIKASLFEFKPTWKNLQEVFERNKKSLEKHISDIRARIDWVLFQEPREQVGLADELKKDDLDLVIRREPRENKIWMTYVDHRYRAAVSAQGLGQKYHEHPLLRKAGSSNYPKQYNKKAPQIFSELVKEQRQINDPSRQYGKSQGKNIVRHR